jgi:integrase/recombinase XerD
VSGAVLTAAEWARMMRAPLRDHSYQLTGLGPAVNDFLAWKRLDGAAERTLDQYERDLARACVLFPERTLETLTAEDVLQVVTCFPAGSRKRVRAALASFFRWAVLWGHVERNPMDRIPRPKQPPGRYVDVFTDAEVAALLNLPDLCDRALMAVLFDVGLREAEARRLQAGRLPPRRAPPCGCRRQGGKDRVVPMSEQLAAVLADLFLVEGMDADDFLWYATKGNQARSRARVMRRNPVGEGTFHRWWARCLGDGGIRYRNPHTARHTFATRWLRRGGGMGTLSKAMGHASIATTVDLYGHLDIDDVARDLALVEGTEIFNPPGSRL